MPKLFYESRTMIFNLLTALLAVVAALQGVEWIIAYPKVAAGLTAAAALINIALRFITSVPIQGSPGDPTTALSGPPNV